MAELSRPVRFMPAFWRFTTNERILLGQGEGHVGRPRKSQREMRYRINRCLLCHYRPIDAETRGRFVTTSCPACLARLRIEFGPPDQPELHARIERIDEPN